MKKWACRSTLRQYALPAQLSSRSHRIVLTQISQCALRAQCNHTSFPFLGISLAPGCEAAIICYYPTLGSASAELASYFIPFRPSVHGDTASSSSTQADMAIRSLRFPCRATVNHVNHDKSRVTKAAFRRRKLSAAVFNFHD